MSDIAAEVREIIVFHLGVEKARVTNDARLAEDLGADSLDRVEIVMSCEEKFDIEIRNNVASGLKTVGDAVRFIEAARATATAEPEPARRAPRLLSAFL